MFLPMLRIGLPAFDRPFNGFLGSFYALSVFACFAAMQAMFEHSPLFLLSAMSLVWVADVGAYFSGKQFGKRKLAPSISPGKTWEGVIGGLISVLLVATLFALTPALADSFSAKLLERLGWLGFVVVLCAVTAASVCGDLFESMLKRRAEMKDSSNLLPGHGGVLDRVDALIPVLPLMALLDMWW
jgi:phosphatidate cytidylyltransferase